MSNTEVLPFPSPPGAGDTWQIVSMRFPGWTEDDDGFFRPQFVLAVSAETGRIGASDLVRPGALDITLVQAAMDNLEEASGTRPATIEVDDSELADALAKLLKGRGIEVSLIDKLPLMAEPIGEMYRELKGDEPYDAAGDVPGVTIEHLLAFAEAAEIFRRAAPWRYLASIDIIEIAAPRPAPNVRFACVLSSHGQIGLGFAEKRSLLEQSPDEGESAVALLTNHSLWSVTYHEPWELPILEHEAWLEHGLPFDPDGRIPSAVQYGPKRRVRRASPKMLAFFEGLFRALAETSEDELDAGEWHKVVGTSLGTLELALSLPDMLAPPAPAEDEPPSFNPLRRGVAMERIRDLLLEQDFESEEEMQAFMEREIIGKELPPPRMEGPEDEARELALEAMDTPGRRGIALARRALALDPDSPIAHITLAERASDPEHAVELYQNAVAAAERSLDPELFKEAVGDFWGVSETRPYMEARKGFADALWSIGRRREAVGHYTELLRLNPNDNQGIRDILPPALMIVGDDKAAEKLLDRYAEDITAGPAFNRALVVFRSKGDTKAARERLTEALERNHHVPDFLLDRARFPEELPAGYTLGSVEEALFYFMTSEEAWAETPGALEWLAERCD